MTPGAPGGKEHAGGAVGALAATKDARAMCTTKCVCVCCTQVLALVGGVANRSKFF